MTHDGEQAKTYKITFGWSAENDKTITAYGHEYDEDNGSLALFDKDGGISAVFRNFEAFTVADKAKKK